MADYSEVDNLVAKQEELLNQVENKQNEIIDTGLQKTQNEVDKQKKEIQEKAVEQGKALYTNYEKQSSDYGVNAEIRAKQGLANSGYSESSKVSLYNTYQKNITSLMTQSNKSIAEADFMLSQAKLDADISKASNAVELYLEKIKNMLNEYQLRYQVKRDEVADEQWQKTYDLQREEFDYQKQRDAQSQANWEREYQLSLASSRR